MNSSLWRKKRMVFIIFDYFGFFGFDEFCFLVVTIIGCGTFESIATENPYTSF